MDIGTTQQLQIIKDTWLKIFARHLSDIEAMQILSELVPNTRKLHEEIPDFSEEKYKGYLEKATSIFFSPMKISEEIGKIVASVGEKEFATAGKYKQARELSVAAMFAMALKKETAKSGC